LQKLVVGAAIILLLLLLPSTVAADNGRIGVLRHVADVPTGFNAEGLAVHEGHLYVGALSFTGSDGTILVYDRSGSLTKTFKVPGLPLVGQIAFGEDNDALFAVTGNLATGKGAIIRLDLESGAVSTVATFGNLPNGLAIDRRGNMFVTDLIAGKVFKVTPEGAVSVFASGPLLAPAHIPGTNFVFGPNDLAFDRVQTALYVSNVGLGTIVKVEVREDGTAGAITNFATGILSPDGVAFDRKGNLYVASPFGNSIFVVARDGSVRTLSLDTTHENLNAPTNLAFLGHRLYITSGALAGGASKISAVVVQYAGLPLTSGEDD